MRNTIVPVLFYLVSFLVFTSFNNAAEIKNTANGLSKELDEVAVSNTLAESKATTSTISSVSALYTNMGLEKAGLAFDIFNMATKGYQRLVDQGLAAKSKYLSIVDFSQSSRKKRLYLLDMENGKLAINTFVSHGKNSGLDMAKHFSNVPESEKSSLGFYVTGQTYFGKHGLSLRLQGLEAGFNNNAERRAIVMHGAEYVNSSRVYSGYMGRSQGCPAVPQHESSKIINMIKGGTVLFIYHPTEKYLKSSPVLNS